MKKVSTLVFAAGFLMVAGVGCKNFMGPKTIKKGSNVRMNYTLTVDGKVVDSSSGREPLSFEQGAGQIIPGLEKALEGLKNGDKKQVTVPPEEGYGVIDPKAVQKVPKASFKDMKNLKVGMPVRGQQGNRPIQATVVAIGAKEITLDFNHPLAGKTLNFDVEIVEVGGPS